MKNYFRAMPRRQPLLLELPGPLLKHCARRAAHSREVSLTTPTLGNMLPRRVQAAAYCVRGAVFKVQLTGGQLENCTLTQARRSP
jgi:hypothetical protein